MSERDYPWEEVVTADSALGFTFKTEEGPMTIMAQFRGVSSTRERAIACTEIAFRSMLDMMGIPWRTMRDDGSLDTGEDDPRDPR